MFGAAIAFAAVGCALWGTAGILSSGASSRAFAWVGAGGALACAAQAGRAWGLL